MIIIIIIIFRVGVSSPRRQRHLKAGQVETFLPAIIAAPQPIRVAAQTRRRAVFYLA